MNNQLKDRIELWKKPPEGIITWIDDVKPKIKGRNLRPIVFEPLDWQKEFLLEALSVENGEYKYTDVISVLPKRHGKSVLMAMIVLYNFFVAMPGSNIKVVANSLSQTKRVGFNILKYVIHQTPFLYKQIGDENLQGEVIYYKQMDAKIEVVTSAEKAMHGEQVSCAWLSELHTASNLDAYLTLSASMGDTANAMLLADTNQAHDGSPVHLVEKMAQDNPSMFFYSFEYSSLEDAIERQPAWLGEKWLRSQYTKCREEPGRFERLHLNKRTASSNRLFSSQNIRAAGQDYPNNLPLDKFKEMIADRKFAIGVGLDRAKSGSLHGDKTILTITARTTDADGEPAYYVLSQEEIKFSLGKTIKKKVIEASEKYGIDKIILEDFDVQDLYQFFVERGFDCDALYPGTKQQVPAFFGLARLFEEGRIFYPRELKLLPKELNNFVFEYTDKGNPTFGSGRKKKDDAVYSLAWSIYALKNQETTVYQLNDIVCTSKSRHARHCYLRNGDMILRCADQCYAHKQVQSMYNSYMRTNVDSELSIQQFFKRLVKVSGIKTYNAL